MLGVLDLNKRVANFDALAVKAQMKFVGLEKVELEDRKIKKRISRGMFRC